MVTAPPSKEGDSGELDRVALAAVDTWGRSVAGAPRCLSDAVTSVEPNDEILRRVVTQVVRREVGEVRAPSSERSTSARRLDPARIDPFAYTADSLRAASSYVATCLSCDGTCEVTCGDCEGTGRAVCPNCRGSGQQRSAKTNRWINCTVCRAKATVSCRRCSQRGVLPCTTCRSSGHQAVWLAFQEKARTFIAFGPPSPVFVAYPVLSEARPLAPQQLEDFDVTTWEAAGEVDRAQLPSEERAFVAERTVGDKRLERTTYQQVQRLAVVRRDVTFKMAGTTGHLVLSGKELVGARTPQAVRPIRRRLILWGVACTLLLVGLLVARSQLSGASSYFDTVRSWTLGLAVAALVASVPALGGLLRAWRGGLQVRGVRRYESVAGVVALAALAAMVGVGLLTRPSPSEVTAALKSGDTHRAREVVEALKELYGSTDSVREAEDAVMLSEAATAKAEDGLQALDAVAARRGSQAANAAARARSIRIGEVNRMLAAHDSQAALESLKRWFPSSATDDPEIAELTARAHEAAAESCHDDACAYSERKAAAAAMASPERSERLARARTSLLANLAAEAPDATPAPRLRHLRVRGELASRALKVAGADTDIANLATAAVARSAERGKTALVGASRDVVAELLDGATEIDATTMRATIAMADVYANLDAKGTCRGIYLVGHDKDHRALDFAAAEKLLSQAVGHPAAIRNPSGGTAPASKWNEGGVRVLARWQAGALIELRVGNAEP